jgi:hypothetical protein
MLVTIYFSKTVRVQTELQNMLLTKEPFVKSTGGSADIPPSGSEVSTLEATKALRCALLVGALTPRR